MASTNTTRLGLVKPTPGTAEPVNVGTQINDSYDKIDAKIGLGIATSSTRPSVPFHGELLRETDTENVMYHNGSSPASGGWTQIPAENSTFEANLLLGASRELIFGGDTNLRRSAANTLRTDDSLSVGVDASVANNLSVSGSAAINGFTSIGGNLAVAGSATVAGSLTVSQNVLVSGNFSALGVGGIYYAMKSTAQSYQSDTSYNNDNDLFFSVVANARYIIEWCVFHQSPAAADIKFQWSGLPVGIDGFYQYEGVGVPTPLAALWPTAVTFNSTGAPSIDMYVGSGGLLVGANAGTITLQHAQVVSTATNTNVYEGSWIRVTRVA